MEGGKKQSCKNRNDGNYNKKFHKSEWDISIFFSCPRLQHFQILRHFAFFHVLRFPRFDFLNFHFLYYTLKDQKSQ